MSALVDGYLNEDQDRVFEGEDFAEEKFFAGAEAYAAAKAEQSEAGYRELIGREHVNSMVGDEGQEAGR